MWSKFYNIVVIDFETTGLSPEDDFPMEVGYLSVSDFDFNETYSSLIKLPESVEVPEFITGLTGITTEKANTEGADKGEVKDKLLSVIDDETLVVAHNANFDLGFLYHHFGIKPKYFMCTRTIEFLTNPEYSSSLEPTYERYFGKVEQEHRALADVEMTWDVLEKQKEIHGDDAMSFFLNKMVVTLDRALVYYPANANVLDFTLGLKIEELIKKLPKILA